MPNDLGQPLNGKMRNNCRFEHDILDNKSKRARCAGFDLRLSKALSALPGLDRVKLGHYQFVWQGVI